jgi:hypothetical protein
LRTSLWGQLRSPDTGSVARIERRVGSRWLTVASVHAGGGRFFRWTGALPRGSLVRLHAGSVAGAAIAVT